MRKLDWKSDNNNVCWGTDPRAKNTADKYIADSSVNMIYIYYEIVLKSTLQEKYLPGVTTCRI